MLLALNGSKSKVGPLFTHPNQKGANAFFQSFQITFLSVDLWSIEVFKVTNTLSLNIELYANVSTPYSSYQLEIEVIYIHSKLF